MKYTVFIILLFSHIFCVAGVFEPITVVKPEIITTDTNVMLGFDPFQTPCLQPLPNYLGQTDLLEIDENNNIDFYITALGTDPCLNIPLPNPPYEFFNLGQFPEGEYHVQLIWVDTSTPLPVPIGMNSVLIGDRITFGVVTPPVIPILGIYSYFILGIAIILLTYFVVRKQIKNNSLIFVLFLVISGNAFSKTFHIMLSNSEGSPTPEDIVNQASTSPPPPVWLLSSFNANPPESVDYLIKERPIDNLLSIVTNNPNWSLSKLYRRLVVQYPDSEDENQILINFSNDSDIVNASFVDPLEKPTYIPPINKTNKSYSISSKGASNIIVDLNINSAWELSEGMGYIGAIDTGLQTNHPELRAFDLSGNFQGGNLLDNYYQIDFGSGDLNVDENEPLDITGIPSFENCDTQDGSDDNLAGSIFIGHGSHVTGIIVGEDHSIGGICKNCGMSMMKYTTFSTNPNHCVFYNGKYTLIPRYPASAAIQSLTTLVNIGMGTVNWSGGLVTTNPDFCDTDNSGACDAKDFALEQNVMLVGAAGNNRTFLQFPAGEIGTVAVGGLDENGGFWNLSPNGTNPYDFTDTTQCPRTGNLECGSNYSYSAIGQKLDVMTQALNVYSTFYEGGEYADDLNCTDFQDGLVDGHGYCTGTSMSTPQVSSILQLMRSAHPLLPNGNYDPIATDGLINILNSTASRTMAGQGVDTFLGYGLPDAELALKKILGISNGIQLKTRLTPMFDVVSSGENNNVYTSFSQVAMAFLLNNGAAYIPNTNVSLVNEFTKFWYSDSLSFPAPRASFYVFTTNNNPFTGVKDMVPLRRMEKTVAGNRNDTYAVSDTEIQSFHDNGYNYAGIEGYILPISQCTSGCPSAIKLYRDETDSLNHKLRPSVNPLPNSTLLGYVYLNEDTDGDGLIDGQERILGTNINVQDTDGDGMTDAEEYPPAGVPFSDPLISDIIFENGFEV